METTLPFSRFAVVVLCCIPPRQGPGQPHFVTRRLGLVGDAARKQVHAGDGMRPGRFGGALDFWWRPAASSLPPPQTRRPVSFNAAFPATALCEHDPPRQRKSLDGPTAVWTLTMLASGVFMIVSGKM